MAQTYDCLDDIDNVMDVVNALEERNGAAGRASGDRVLVGSIERFFDHLSVAAIRLTDKLSVGDTIEIESGEYTLRQKVSSMQINRSEVESAGEGDDVGIKVSVPVPDGSRVYKLG